MKYDIQDYTPFPATERLFTIRDAFDYSDENRKLFAEAMREMVDMHCSHSRVFEGLCRLDGYTSDMLHDDNDALNIPHIIVSAFKEMRLLSVPEEEIVTTFTSSGTSGHVSQINWDMCSQERQLFMRDTTVETFGLAEYDREVNYLCFSYDPGSSGSKGAAQTHRGYMKYAHPREIVYAISSDKNGTPVFRKDECIAALDRFAKSGLPLRVTGFPAFGYVTMRALEEMGKSYTFPAGSLMFSGGGWKLHTGEAVPFDEYAALANRTLGISRDRIRDIYGMVEHGVPYLTCEHGMFHVPIWSRVCAVNPGDCRILPDGEVGLLKFVTPYITSSPAISVLSTDLGEVRRECRCGRRGGVIILHGRGGVKKYDGCAISAAQLLGQ
jgi:phenylacetate-coenzyme A ligase PaaK-like adenylate-forming protein